MRQVNEPVVFVNWQEIGRRCERLGMSVIAVQRNGKVETRLGPDFRFLPTDELLVLGSHEQRRTLRAMLE